MNIPNWIITAGVCLVQAVRFFWLNIFSILALALGVVFVACVPQAHEIFANLGVTRSQLGDTETMRSLHVAFFVAASLAWGLTIWYSMRVLSSTRFPNHLPPSARAQSFAAWINREVPRLGAFAGLAVLASVSSVHLDGVPTLRWAAILAAGIVPLTWGIMRSADKLFGHGSPANRDYLLPALVVGVVAAALAIVAWWNLPHDWRGRGLLALLGYTRTAAGDLEGGLIPELVPGLSGVLLIVAALTSIAAVLLRKRSFGTYLILAALVIWVASVATGPVGLNLWLPLGLLLVAILGLWWTSRRRSVLSMRVVDPGEPDPHIETATWRALVLTIVALVILIVGFSNAPISLGNWLGTLAIVFLALSLWCFFGTFFWVLLPKRSGWSSLAAFPVLWAAIIGLPADHELRGTQFENLKRYAVRPGISNHFEQWRAKLPNKDDSPIFFVAAAGGGLRAGLWTANLLASMDDRTCGEFGRHVYALSGVSGGSLGIAAYLAQKRVWDGKSPADRCKADRGGEMTRMLGRDFLAPVVGSLLFAEAFQLFVPWTYLENERGTTLANAWSKAWDDAFGAVAPGRFAEPFLSAFQALIPGSSSSPSAGSSERILPAVFLNATGVESGRRVIASNVHALLPGADDLFFSSMDTHGGRLKTYGLSVAEAVLNSARFTYVSPAGTVMGCYPNESDAEDDCSSKNVKVWGRVVDGGYFENSGLTTLIDVIRLLDADNAPQARSFKNPVFIIIIDNGDSGELACPGTPLRVDLRNGMSARLQAEEALRKQGLRIFADISPPVGRLPLMSETTAPIEAMLNVREARASLEVRRVSAEFDCPYVLDWSLLGDDATRLKARQQQQQPALGWFLSRRSAGWMLSRVKDYADSLPFDLAACDDGKEPTRGILGDPGIRPATCPKAPVSAPGGKPSSTGTR